MLYVSAITNIRDDKRTIELNNRFNTLQSVKDD